MKIKLFCLFSIGIALLSACGHKATEQNASAQQSTPAAAVETSANQSADAQTALPWAGHTDLVCQMDVAETAEDTVHYQGKVYGFCSAHCKEKFQKNPEKYAAK
jgi:YHS domain-containing protein